MNAIVPILPKWMPHPAAFDLRANKWPASRSERIVLDHRALFKHFCRYVFHIRNWLYHDSLCDRASCPMF